MNYCQCRTLPEVPQYTRLILARVLKGAGFGPDFTTLTPSRNLMDLIEPEFAAVCRCGDDAPYTPRPPLIPLPLARLYHTMSRA